jgi:hypothetical protein
MDSFINLRDREGGLSDQVELQAFTRTHFDNHEHSVRVTWSFPQYARATDYYARAIRQLCFNTPSNYVHSTPMQPASGQVGTSSYSAPKLVMMSTSIMLTSKLRAPHDNDAAGEAQTQYHSEAFGRWPASRHSA